VYQPIFAAGPNQEGFTLQEKAALETQVTDATAKNYADASTAVNQKLATLGGGTMALPSGATAQIQAQIAQSAAQEQSAERLNITSQDYAQGYNKWLEAGQGMFGISNALNPAQYMSVANQGGSAASTTANDIATQSNAWINAAIGAAGAIGGGALSGRRP
jgi:hypothetical protein